MKHILNSSKVEFPEEEDKFKFKIGKSYHLLLNMQAIYFGNFHFRDFSSAGIFAQVPLVYGSN